MDEKTIARFWARVDRFGPVPAQAPHIGACWIYTRGTDRHGYGRFGVGRVVILAHRFAYAARRRWREVPAGLQVLHRCDNPPCCNPAHLFLGTPGDNMADKVAKGRQAKGATSGAHSKPDRRPRGELHGNAVLSDADVATIRRLYRGRDAGPTQDDLAVQFGVSRAAINDIVRARTRTQGAKPTRTDQRFKLTDAQVAEIRAAYRGPRPRPTQTELARRFGVTQAQIQLIVSGKSRRTHEPSNTHNPGDQ